MKKFLSMVMALAMTLTLVTVGASAKDFTDKSTINYKEAVDVISTLGVVDGYTDGSYNPTATLTRGAAAKIICNLLLGPTAASALGVTSAPFKDVPVSNVFAGYIAYCSSQGIINGYGNGYFQPAATVTGFQFLKMLLGALGYDGSIEGFTGTNWAVNVAKLAITTGLTDGNDSFVGSKAMTRQEAALYALNLLQTPMVQYANKGTKITQADGTVISIGATAASPIDSTTKNTINTDNKYLEFGEQYFPKLKLDQTTKTDDFGRAANIWSYKNVDIGTYPTDTDVVVSYSAKTKESVVSSDLKGYNVSSLMQTGVWINGLQEGVSATTGSSLVANVTGTNGIEDLTGNGRIVEVYADGKDINKIVVINYVLGKVTSVSDKNETITVKNQANGQSYTSEAGYGDYAKDSYIMIAPKATSLTGAVPTYSTSANALAVATTTKVSGKISSVVKDDYAVVDGTKYSSAANYVDGTFNPVVSDSATVSVYLDSFGYIVSCDATAAAGNYLLVTKAAWLDHDSMGNNVYKAQMVFTDGTTGVYTVKSVAGSTVGDGTPAVGLYQYTVSGSKYELTAAKATASTANYGQEADNVTIKSTTASLNTGHYFADDVNYIVVTNPGTSDMKASLYTGKQATAGEVDVYYLTSKSVESDEKGTITTAFVVGSDVVTSSKDVIYTTAAQVASNGSTIINGTRYSTYSVYLDGVKTTIPVKGSTTPTANAFFTYGVDADGVYSLVSTSSNVKTGAVVTAYNNYVTVAGITDTLTATDDIKVVDVRSGSPDPTIESVSDLADTAGTVYGSVVYDSQAKTVSYIFITDSADTSLSGLTINGAGSAATLYATAAEAVAGTKATVGTNTVITLTGATLASGASAAYTIDNGNMATFSAFTSGTTTTSAAAATDVLKIVVTAKDGGTTQTYYTAITVS